MDAVVGFAVQVLRLVPLIVAFYVPALLGVAIFRERGEAYRVKAALVLVLGFGLILAVRLFVGSGSALEVSVALMVSLAQIAVALLLAALTVYKLAD